MAKTHRGLCSEEKARKAIKAESDCAPLKSSATAYRISLAAPQRHKNGKVKQSGTVPLGQYRSFMNKKYKVELVSKIQYMEKSLFDLTTKEI